MRKICGSMAAVVLAGAVGSAMGQGTMPAVGVAPAIAPVAAMPVRAGVRVLVIPFTTLNVPDSQRWIGQAVQEDIVADFGHSGMYSPIAFQGDVVVEDNATAARLAKAAGATLAVRGAAQMVEQNVRITAQLIDASSGDTVATASATGTAADLLKLEDSLSADLRAVPGQSAGSGGVAGPIQPPAVATAAPTSTGPIINIIIPSAPVQQQPEYPVQNTGYGPYDYGYGGYGVPIFITGFPFHDHDHDHDHGGGGHYPQGLGPIPVGPVPRGNTIGMGGMNGGMGGGGGMSHGGGGGIQFTGGMQGGGGGNGGQGR